MTEGRSNKKILIIILAAVAVLAVIVAILFFTLRKKDSYRSIMVYDLKGTATITREGIGEMKAAVNLFLESKDEVEVAKESSMRLKLDDDKFIMAEAETKFRIIADGDRENSRTKIDLMEGAITNEIRNKLNAQSSYEVTTPNSVMAVRGTIFRVHTYVGSDGRRYTVVTVTEGIVATRLIQPNGKVSDEEEMVCAGEFIIIVEDENKTIYLKTPGKADYSALPKDVLEFFLEIAKTGTDIGISVDELEDLIAGFDETEEPEDAEEENGYVTVTFLYQGNVFATEHVYKGRCAEQPILKPEAEGAWDFDFTTVVEEDMVVEWKSE